MSTAEDFRELALALPAVTDKAAWSTRTVSGSRSSSGSIASKVDAWRMVAGPTLAAEHGLG